MSKTWRVRLTHQAEADLLDIVTWTTNNFSSHQADEYAETLMQAIEALHDGPGILGVKARDDIYAGALTIHIARQGRKGRHFIVFRTDNEKYIDVLRVLHDRMDLARHINPASS